MMKIDRVLAVSAGTKETKVDCHCQTVVVSNNSANVAYIAPFDPNKSLTAAAGFSIPANTVLQSPQDNPLIDLYTAYADFGVGWGDARQIIFGDPG